MCRIFALNFRRSWPAQKNKFSERYFLNHCFCPYPAFLFVSSLATLGINSRCGLRSATPCTHYFYAIFYPRGSSWKKVQTGQTAPGRGARIFRTSNPKPGLQSMEKPYGNPGRLPGKINHFMRNKQEMNIIIQFRLKS